MLSLNFLRIKTIDKEIIDISNIEETNINPAKDA